MTVILENTDIYGENGVSVEVAPIREYKTDVAAHILGRVGIIYREEYAELKKKGYKMT